ncbi:bifunctional UDP-N-acetylglucosamine diphosphorylase/glucosamine-1-phosphate N-acetyltransferase GlmU [Rhizobium sp. KVB221]|uniref:Bifunctional protein GlmU n=1 Tax=Rhizobium setariae TaxID=2801340 RepID=A0A937CQG6_9HYPH|nr:bifunctional UDP-N-acetylglucosamine diphosphorylase/glucosamine-1-phosphate N-acetyltransferase GlmU [Rhizobium setariae]MBL0372982.1 bifunctional UDP-N-acetylglucosamine diphosphorylase/glucosamine-1-phosphate N-acetyltransferase GlmU [Rhizobium setariae]
MAERILAVVLAAGESTRMKSAKSKVLHTIGNLPMISHVMLALEKTGVEKVALVVGRDAAPVVQAASSGTLAVQPFEQKERLGTGHAVLAARDEIEKGYDQLLIAYGDAPLIGGAPLIEAVEKVRAGHDVAVIGFRTPKPTGYGRLLEKDGELIAIREEKDATAEERRVEFCNSGLMAIDGRKAAALLSKITNNNVKGEYYLTDIIEVVRAEGGKAATVEASVESVAGCNNRAELAELEAIWQRNRRHELMLAGVTMIAPETVFLSHDTEIGVDTTIEPNVIFGPGVKIERNVTIHAFSHLEGAYVTEGASVGPFARLRPGANLGRNAKVGNFCEVKKADIGEGAKVNHLSYIGDATIGPRANIGAGTITCNYDGFNKYETRIGADAFIGSNSALVAPVSIGDGALTASGSVITSDVPAGAAAFGRARQYVKEGYGSEIMARNKALKESKKK